MLFILTTKGILAQQAFKRSNQQPSWLPSTTPTSPTALIATASTRRSATRASSAARTQPTLRRSSGSVLATFGSRSSLARTTTTTTTATTTTTTTTTTRLRPSQSLSRLSWGSKRLLTAIKCRLTSIITTQPKSSLVPRNHLKAVCCTGRSTKTRWRLGSAPTSTSSRQSAALNMFSDSTRLRSISTQMAQSGRAALTTTSSSFVCGSVTKPTW